MEATVGMIFILVLEMHTNYPSRSHPWEKAFNMLSSLERLIKINKNKKLRYTARLTLWKLFKKTIG